MSLSPTSLRRFVGLFALAAVVVAQPHGVHAYSTPDAFLLNPSSGGGGGRWFSGSPADGYGCSVCHTGTPTKPIFPLLVAGLALDGYELSTAREVVLSWPSFSQRWKELRPDPTQPVDPAAAAPSVGLVAEFVAESGKASGTIEIRGATAGAAERCEATRPNLQARVAARMYQVRPGVAPLEIKADRSGTLRCDSRQLGQRCIVALKSCGAEELRIVWTAPPSEEGPVWFSAGFVATDALSGTPEDDSVVELAMPMNSLGSSSGSYQRTLRSACSVSNVGVGANTRPLVSVLLLLAIVLIATRSRRRLLLSAVALTLVACGIEPADRDPSAYPGAGLYTPGSAIGASDPTDMPDPTIVYSNRCVSPAPVSGGMTTITTGELAVVYHTQTVDGRYAPKNCSAVWIETIDDQFVATLEISAQLRRPGLVYWQDQGCTEKLGPDVVASATKVDHELHDKAKWTGVDLNGVPMPDGEYRLYIEVTETDKEPGELDVFTFTKGPTAIPLMLSPTIDGLDPDVPVLITWTPTP